MKQKLHFIALFLIFSLLLTAFPVCSIAEDTKTTYEDVTKYTYSITPILSPFLYAVYVKTDNPDPTSFRFVDRDTVYATENETEGYYILRPRHYQDVLYENEETYRVNGGYIFYNGKGLPDGGKLTLQQKTGEGGGTVVVWENGSEVQMDGEYEDTKITVSCPRLQTDTDYLLATYASEQSTFFDKMDAVQNALEKIAIYPRAVQDSNQPTGKYPALASSGYYPELSLNEHYETLYKSTDGLLLSFAYPFVLSSTGFPGLMRTVAEQLDPSAEISAGWSHPYINVTLQDTTKTYGGAGSGGDDPLYTKHVKKWFTFDNTSSDYYNTGTIESYHQLLSSFRELAAADASKQRELLAGETFKKTIQATGGTWIRIAVEYMFSSGTSFGYALPTNNGDILFLADAFVDGRYIDDHEIIGSNGSFDAHPTASIVVQQMEYTEWNGTKHKQDVLFRYDNATNCWLARSAFAGPYEEELPDEFVLTRSEVETLHVDSHSGQAPKTGLIYDGTAYPGTPFSNIMVTKIHTQKELQIINKNSIELIATVIPENATYQQLVWSSSDDTIARIIEEYDFDTNSYRYFVKGEKPGVAVLTVRALGGDAEAVCTVTVLEELSGKCGENLSWTLKNDGVLTITGTGAMYNYEYDFPNDSGTSPWFNNPKIKSVVISDGVSSIGNHAFQKCHELISVSLPKSIASIGRSAFEDCSALPDITIPNNVFIIDVRAFFGCKNLTSIRLPDGKTRDYSIEVATVRYGDITSVTVSPTDWDEYITGVLEGSSDNVSTDWDEYLTSVIAGYSDNVSTIPIERGPGSATSLGGAAGDLSFWGISNGATLICDNAFSDCTHLKTISFPTSLTIYGAGVFDQTAWFEEQPDGIVYAGNVAYKYKGEMPENTKIELKNGTVEIAGCAFYGYDTLTEIILSEDVQFIGHGAFSNCKNLISITMSGGISDIAPEAFYHCNSLKNIYFTGTKEEWKSVSYCIRDYNEPLSKATIHYVEPPKAEIDMEKKQVVALPGTSAEVLKETLTNVTRIIDKDGKDIVLPQIVGTGATVILADGIKLTVFVYMDPDGDGNISAADARLALRRSVGLETYEKGSPAFLACDVDLDGNVSAADARLILRASVGLEDPKTWIK